MSETDQTPAAGPAAAAAEESRVERLRRHGHRGLLYTWSAVGVAALVILILLVVENTRHVRVSWVFGHSRTSLIWLVVVPAIVGWIGGIATAVLFRYRTRRPRG